MLIATRTESHILARLQRLPCWVAYPVPVGSLTAPCQRCLRCSTAAPSYPPSLMNSAKATPAVQVSPPSRASNRRCSCSRRLRRQRCLRPALTTALPRLWRRPQVRCQLGSWGSEDRQGHRLIIRGRTGPSRLYHCAAPTSPLKHGPSPADTV